MATERAMRFDALLADTGLTLVRGGDVVVRELTDDSRRVTPGCLFVARGGTKDDGNAYVADAVSRGATAIVATSNAALPNGLPDTLAVATAEQVDQALAGRLANRFFGDPSRELALVGVTGTNGKTTVAFLVQHMLKSAGVKCGLLGTVWVDTGAGGDDGSADHPGVGAGRTPAELTTPGAIDLVRYLAQMVEYGCRAAVAEFSSHGLDQGRTACLALRAGVFTNLTPDHYDYHATVEDYADAKAKLFDQLPADAWAIVNADDPHGVRMVRDFPGGASRVTWCTLKGKTKPRGGVVCRADVLDTNIHGSRARFDGMWGSVEVTLPLIGRYNVSNALQALAAAHAVTDMSRVVKRALASVPDVPGRMERVTADSPFGLGNEIEIETGRARLRPSRGEDCALDSPRGSDGASPSRQGTSPSQPVTQPTVLVDYAHTPDALDNVLRAARRFTRGRLIALFGCGGDRDITKRATMAQAACHNVDAVVVTSDNPRTEDPDTIINDVLEGVPEGANVTVERDRALAIRLVIDMAEADDVVVLAGKGHEDYQIVGTVKHRFDDREHAAEALRRWTKSRRKAPAST